MMMQRDDRTADELVRDSEALMLLYGVASDIDADSGRYRPLLDAIAKAARLTREKARMTALAESRR